MPRLNFAIKPVLSIVLALLAAGVLMIGTAPTVHAASITVNSTATAVDGTDGDCTLIEAIIAANDNAASGNESGECAASVDCLSRAAADLDGHRRAFQEPAPLMQQ